MTDLWQSLVDFWPTLLSFLAFFFGFSFLVFIHELGHFAVARAVGIKCTQFAVGMGHAICSWRKGIGFRVGGTEAEYQRRVHAHLSGMGESSMSRQYRTHNEDLPADSVDTSDYTPEQINAAAEALGLGDTEYRLNWLPLGGYVKMLGQEDMDPAARSNDPRSFNSKSVGARMAVISAGVIMNLVFGIVLLAWAFSIGVNFPVNSVGEVVPYTPAWSTYAEGHANDPDYHGLKPGDQLVSLDGKPIKDFLDLKLGVALAHPDATLDVVVKRDGEGKPLHFRLKPVKGNDGLLSVGMAPISTLTGAQVVEDPDDLDAKPVEMRLTSIDGKPVDDYAAYLAAVSADPRQTKSVTFVDEKSDKTLTKTVASLPVLQQDQTNPKSPRTHLLGMRPAVRAAAFSKDAPATAAGMKKGDLVARIGDQAWPTPEELQDTVSNADNQPLALVVWRDGELVELGTVTPVKDRIGIYLGEGLGAPIVSNVLPGSPTAALRMPAGSRIVSIDGKPVADWADMQLAVADAQAGSIDVTYIANIANEPTENGSIELSSEALQEVQLAGWALQPTGYFLVPQEEPLKADNVVEAAGLGVSRTKDFMVQAYLTLARLMQRTIGVEQLSGPVGIVNIGTTLTHERGFPYLLFFLGLLSVNLAVINFLPVPIVDGGHAVFLIIEKLKGSPVSANVQAAATYVGLGFIGLVFIVVTYNDIVKLLPQ